MTTENIKDKIRGLLNISKDDAASEHEVETALKIAQKLMAKHHLSEDDLEEDPLRQAEAALNAEKGKTTVPVDGKVYTWECILARCVAENIVKGLGYYQQKTTAATPSGLLIRDAHGNWKTVGAFTFYGVAEDVEIACRIFTEIRTAIIALARLRYGSVFRGDGAAYAEGFAQGIIAKAKMQDQQEHSEAQARLTGPTPDNRGLILIARRNDLIRQKNELATKWLASPAGGGIKLRTSSRSGSSGSGDARSQGRKDGASYGVNASRSKKLC